MRAWKEAGTTWHCGLAWTLGFENKKKNVPRRLGHSSGVGLEEMGGCLEDIEKKILLYQTILGR
jgi:hypothetical protein